MYFPNGVLGKTTKKRIIEQAGKERNNVWALSNPCSLVAVEIIVCS